MTKKYLALFIVFAALPFTAFAVAFPGPTSCLLVGASNLGNQTATPLSADDSTTSQSGTSQLVDEARRRIEATFGKPAARPTIVFLGSTSRIGPFSLNAYGSTQFVGHRTCVMIGPKGRSVDIVAHELMHAELHHRVGSLKYFLKVPTWFDEGVAMQVDFRSRYALREDKAAEADRVRELTTSSKFFVSDDKALTQNYSFAKYEVSKWLSVVGSDTLYSRLARLKSGETFSEILAR
ncbi:hypothetical protein [Hydrogenophaga sp.]|uniref:hypothetical protein n=1 Tax=Hydrogenophaga sp. TaxID=1904254 RepID=UPI00261F2B86|nr:hypothetical protein [Hydrogenophaga sp.]MDM7951403.1 hypothetical protein [Hydrogenophaga sp.]